MVPSRRLHRRSASPQEVEAPETKLQPAHDDSRILALAAYRMAIIDLNGPLALALSLFFCIVFFKEHISGASLQMPPPFLGQV